MFRTKKFLNQMIRLSFLAGLFVTLGFTGSMTAFAAGPAPVNLLSADNFVILAETGITNTGSHTSVITGNIGNSPGTSAQMDGVWCSEITGTIYGVDAAYTGNGTTTCFAGNPPSANKTLVDNAVGDMLTAYNNAAAVVTPAPVVELGAGNIGGMTLAPGLYKWSTDVDIATNLTLSGGANDVWIFQISGDLTIASGGSVPAGIKVLLSGGAQASNVFWQVGGVTGATIGTYATFNGTILSAKQIIIETGAVLNGRALAQTQVTLDADVINSSVSVPPVCPVISLLPTTLPVGTVNVVYSQPVAASGGTGPYTYSTTAGTLQADLSLSGDGVISGTPTTSGTFGFTVTATDQNDCTGLRQYTLVINPVTCPLISLLPTTLPEGTVNAAYNETITASGGAGPYSFTMTTGTLPIGLSPITTGGIIAGTPTTSGTFKFTVTATDQNGCTGLLQYTLVINPEQVAQVGTIIVEKQTLPDGSTEQFEFTGEASGMIGDGEVIVVGGLAAGTYTSTEIVPTGWDLTGIVCDDGNSTGNTGNATASFNVEAGEIVRCVFTNTQQTVELGTIIVEKQTLPDGSAELFEFTGEASGLIGDGETIVVGGLAAGTYTSTEIVPTGWDLTGIVCDDGNSTGNIGNATASFNVEAGETVRCVFTNTQQIAELGTIVVEKRTTPSGATDIFAFTGDASGNIGDGGQIVVSNLPAGVYLSTETVPYDWSLNSIVCDDDNSTGDIDTATASFNLEAGENVVCVFNNSKIIKSIPTLNQYALGLMALLMLGFGLVGFRRFI